ncbi:ATP-binding protein [[Kitasatospora] papulosa]|uniref:ATP-binding protein n=1 Tax=Streptomyces TaxID=1883 RepID=UPI00341B05C0
MFQLESGATQLARLHARTRLTMLRWPGNRESATQVVGILIGNAVKHADPGAQHEDRLLRLRLAITEDHALLIDVEDPLPEFRQFEQARAGEIGGGLWTVRRLGGALSWHLPEHGGKAVRARLIPGLVQP